MTYINMQIIFRSKIKLNNNIKRINNKLINSEDKVLENMFKK